jgi:hypothetical protein
MFVFNLLLLSFCATLHSNMGTAVALRPWHQNTSEPRHKRTVVGGAYNGTGLFLLFLLCNSPIKEKAKEDRGAATYELRCVYCRCRQKQARASGKLKYDSFVAWRKWEV